MGQRIQDSYLKIMLILKAPTANGGIARPGLGVRTYPHEEGVIDSVVPTCISLKDSGS